MGFENQFLDYVFYNHILNENEIVYSPKSIVYFLDSEKHLYFPDFYVPKWNLIVEIKSTYTMRTDKNLLLKENATKHAGFNYIRIIDVNRKLNFDEFDSFIFQKIQ